MDSKFILVALNQVSGIGPKTIARLMHHWPKLEDLIQEYLRGKLRTHLPPALHYAIGQLNWQQAEYEWNWTKHINHHIVTILDENYPRLLLQIPDPPPVLYVKGSLSQINHQILAVVGSRKPSLYGQNIAYDWSQALSKSGITLVSGMAIGIDTLVHQACVYQNQVTYAVLGSGLQRIYPKRNEELAGQIIEKGALISEFSLKTPPNPGHFPLRNRIISGLALSTLVVEATEKSGTLITALHAINQNRDVYVVPGRVDVPYHTGAHRLIQQGARLVMHYQDILDEYA
jgi:DNA processing protein